MRRRDLARVRPQRVDSECAVADNRARAAEGWVRPAPVVSCVCAQSVGVGGWGLLCAGAALSHRMHGVRGELR